MLRNASSTSERYRKDAQKDKKDACSYGNVLHKKKKQDKISKNNPIKVNLQSYKIMIFLGEDKGKVCSFSLHELDNI